MSETINELIKVIKKRKSADKNLSYTSLLLSEGLNKCIDKMEEEFKEFKEALRDDKNIVHEGADLLYHFLVSLESANINYNDILEELEKRKNKSGIEEKKQR